MIDIARAVALEASTVLMERFGRLSGSEIQRHGRRDVTTAADQAAEQHIERRLGDVHPDIPVLG